MPSLKITRCKNEFEANILLRGGIRLPLPYKGNERIYGLHNLTLIFTAPAKTITFSDASGAGLLIKEILAAINNGNVLKATIRDSVLFVVQPTPSAGVVLGAAGTANQIMGIKAGVVVTGTFYNAPTGAAPRLISFQDTGVMDGYTLVTEEE